MQVLDDRIDFDAFLDPPDEGANVRPASAWMADVLEAFRSPAEQSGATLPWGKTASVMRLRHGELSIWPGMSGHGKSLIVGQVMLGLMAQGEKVCIASMEMKPSETAQRLCRQAFACNAPHPWEVEKFLHWTDDRLWLYDQQGSVTPERILAVARYCHEKLGVTHFVIDNLMTCGIPEDGEGWQSRQKQFVLNLSCHAHDTRQAVHLLAHVRKGRDELSPPSKFDVRGSASITDLADNVLTVWRNKPKEKAREDGVSAHQDEPDCLLIVDKNRHGNWEGKFKLWFDRMSQSYTDSASAVPQPLRMETRKTHETETVEF